MEPLFNNEDFKLAKSFYVGKLAEAFPEHEEVIRKGPTPLTFDIKREAFALDVSELPKEIRQAILQKFPWSKDGHRL